MLVRIGIEDYGTKRQGEYVFYVKIPNAKCLCSIL